MQEQIHDIDECELEDIQSHIPVNMDSVKKIGLTPKEKRAIFFCLREEIKKGGLKAIEAQNTHQA